MKRILLVCYFWASTIAAVIAGAFSAEAMFEYTQYSKQMTKPVFGMLIAAPYLALNALAISAVLLWSNDVKRFWWRSIILQLVLYSGFAYVRSMPEPWVAEEQGMKSAFERAKNAYVADLNKSDYANAEAVYVKAIESAESDFPKRVACIAAEFSSNEGLAFSIKLQHKYAERLSRLGGIQCNVVTWAVEHGQVTPARIAVENGEVFSESDVSNAVSNNAWDDREKGITDEQRTALFQLATKHHFVSKEDMSSLLAEAVDQGRPLLVRAIVQSAGGAKALPDEGGRAILAAVGKGWEAIAMLLELGIDINASAVTNYGKTSTALVEAVNAKHSDSGLVAALLEHGASTRPVGSRAPLALALAHCDLPVARLLLSHGADPNANDAYENVRLMPLGLALTCVDDEHVGEAALEFAAEMIKHGANPNHQYEPALYLVHEVCMRTRQNEGPLELLKTVGADINVRDKRGRTALMLDLNYRLDDVAKLLACGMAVNARDHLGKTALDYMHQRGYRELMQILCAHGAEPAKWCVGLEDRTETLVGCEVGAKATQRVEITRQRKAGDYDRYFLRHGGESVPLPGFLNVSQENPLHAKCIGTAQKVLVAYARFIKSYQGACQIFCVERGHEIIPKGLFHDRSDDHQEAQETESCVPVPG